MGCGIALQAHCLILKISFKTFFLKEWQDILFYSSHERLTHFVYFCTWRLRNPNKITALEKQKRKDPTQNFDTRSISFQLYTLLLLWIKCNAPRSSLQALSVSPSFWFPTLPGMVEDHSCKSKHVAKHVAFKLKSDELESCAAILVVISELPLCSSWLHNLPSYLTIKRFLLRYL